MTTDTATIDLLACLRKHGQCLDVDIAGETGLAVADVRAYFTKLLTTGEVIACNLTRFDKGRRLDAVMYRASGYVPPVAPGRKPNSPPAAT